MPKLILTLYISDTAIRMMTADGRQVQDWAELPLEPGMIENNVIIEEEAVAERLKQLFSIKAVTARRVLVGISGIRCLTRPIQLPKLPGEILDEAVRREAVRLLPVSLNELYLSWQTIPAPEGKTQVFLTAIPRRTMDPLMKVLDRAGIKPAFVDIKPLLLARTARQETVILVDIQDTDFDIVIMVNGVPQPIRTIPFPFENSSWQDKLIIIREELDRTITFYNTNNPDTAVKTDIPVYVSGQAAEEASFREGLAEELHREVLMLPSPVESPSGFSPSVYMANIGLVLQEAASGKNTGPSVVNLNTLPVEFRPQPVSSLNILKMLGIALALMLAVGMVFLYQNTASSISSKKVALDSTRTLLQQSQEKARTINASLNDLKSQIAAIETLQSNFTAALGTIELQSLGLNRDLEVTMESLPGGISLSGIQHESGVLTISGSASTEKTVSAYISRLAGTGRFSDIEIQEMSIQDDSALAFTLRGSLLVESDWISSIEIILGNLPGSITLEFAATADGALTITGNSPDEGKLMAYLNKLDESGKFSEINITGITRADDGSMDFGVVLKIGD